MLAALAPDLQRATGITLDAPRTRATIAGRIAALKSQHHACLRVGTECPPYGYRPRYEKTRQITLIGRVLFLLPYAAGRAVVNQAPIVSSAALKVALGRITAVTLASSSL